MKKKIFVLVFTLSFVMVIVCAYSNYRSSFNYSYRYCSLEQQIKAAVLEDLFDPNIFEINFKYQNYIVLDTNCEYNVYYYNVSNTKRYPYAKITQTIDDDLMEIDFYNDKNKVLLMGKSFSYWFYCDDDLNVIPENIMFVPVEDGGDESKSKILSLVNESDLREMIKYFYDFTYSTMDKIYEYSN